MKKKAGSEFHSRRRSDAAIKAPFVLAVIWVVVAVCVQTYCFSEGLIQSSFCYSFSSDRMIGIMLFLIVFGVVSVQIFSGIAVITSRLGG